MSEPNGRNGFRVRSWTDVAAVIVVTGAVVGALVWGLKLDLGYHDHEGRISKIEERLESVPPRR